MTPKEKAADLIDKMMLHYLSDMYGSHLVGIPEAKQCALICVEEIMSNGLKYISVDKVPENKKSMTWEYWEQVKTEIEKL
jgi:hypothetical protein